MPITIAHISDLHLACRPSLREWRLKRILGYTNQLLNRWYLHKAERLVAAIKAIVSNPPDVVIITGDMTQNGLDSEFAAVDEALQPLKANNIPVLTVLGNHEFYGASSAAVPSFLVTLRRKWRLGLEPDEKGVYTVNDVEILPLEQAQPTPLFVSRGKVREEDVAALSRSWRPPLSDARPARIAFGHYPLLNQKLLPLSKYTRLEGSEDLAAVLAACGVSAYFCGHTHKRFFVDLPGGIRQFAAGSITQDGYVGRYLVNEHGVTEFK